MNDEISLDEAIQEGLLAARKAFEDTISKYCYDPAYTDIKFTAWAVDSSLTIRLRRFEIEGEVK